MSDDKEPKRPAPSSGRTTGANWANLTPDEFEKAERELRESIRSRSSGDFTICDTTFYSALRF
jgi:hypothetical protein